METSSGPSQCLIHVLPSNRWGGVERYVFDICRHFRDTGWDVVTLTRDAKAVDNLFEKEGLSLEHAPLRGMFDFFSIKVISDLLKRKSEKSIVVNVHGFRQAFSVLLARKLSGNKNVRIILTRHKVKGGADTWLFNRIYRHIDAIIFVSALSKERFLSTWYGRKRPFDESRLHILPNSLNKEFLSFQHREARGPVVAMFHGPLKPGKGLETLIDSLKLIKGVKFRLRIMGSGKPDYVDRLRRRALARGVMDIIHWHKHVDDPIPLIEDCDFGILPSVEREAFGLSNIEYMARGRAQITTTNGAQSEYLTDGREAFLVPPGNAGELANAIEKLVADRELRERMGERAFYKFTRDLTWPGFISHLSEIYSI